jgi:hypothetical protein
MRRHGVQDGDAERAERAARDIRALLPLGESGVERFEVLAVELADIGTAATAEVLFTVLDDYCPLGGVMQSVTNLLQEFQPQTLFAALVATLPHTSTRAEHCLRDILRGAVLSAEHSTHLRAVLPTLESTARDTIQSQLHAIGRSKTYAAACAAVLEA